MILNSMSKTQKSKFIALYQLAVVSFVIIIAICLFESVTVYAMSKFTISGYVKSIDGVGVSGINVCTVNSNGVCQKTSSQTNITGYYEITGLSGSRSYVLKITDDDRDKQYFYKPIIGAISKNYTNLVSKIEINNSDISNADFEKITVPEATSGFTRPMNSNDQNYGYTFGQKADYSDWDLGWVYHMGQDYNSSSNQKETTPIRPVADGVVVDVRPNDATINTWGGMVIKHWYRGEAYYSQYGHINTDTDLDTSGIQPLVIGQNVTKGTTLIGYEDNIPSGAVHLHFEIRNSKHPNPYYRSYWQGNIDNNSGIGVIDNVYNWYEHPDAFICSSRAYTNPYRIVIEERSSSFSSSGDFIHDDETSLGFGGHMQYETTTLDGTATAWGKWSFHIAKAGFYQIETYIPNNHGTSEKAVYKIDGNSTPAINQFLGEDEWITVKEIHFFSEGNHEIKLSNNTGESNKQLAFDAVQVTYIGFGPYDAYYSPAHQQIEYQCQSTLIQSYLDLLNSFNAAKYSSSGSSTWRSRMTTSVDLRQSLLSGSPDQTISLLESSNQPILESPSTPANRAETLLLAMLVHGDTFEENLPSSYTDVPATHDLYDVIETATKFGIVRGYDGVNEGTFGPENSVTRIEALAIIFKTFGLDLLEGTNTGPRGRIWSDDLFDDVKTSDWWYNYVKAAYLYEIMDGFGNKVFGTNENITRSQLVKIVHQAMQLSNSSFITAGHYYEPATEDYSDANSPPEGSVSIEDMGNGTYRLTANISDPENDTVNYYWVAQGGGFKNINSNESQVEWTSPKSSQAAEYSIQLWAYDNKGLMAVIDEDLHVEPAPSDPFTSYEVLTPGSHDVTVYSAEYMKVFGSGSGDTINIESGGRVDCSNFSGATVVNFEEDSTGFTVYRSGATVYFENTTTGTVVKLPATKTAQTISFTDGSCSLSIVSDQVILSDQVVLTVPSTVENVVPVSSGECGAYVAPGVWMEFDCYNLAAIGKTTGDDPFTPSWRLIGGYWQWGQKGPDSSQWYDTNTPNFAHGPTGPDADEANDVVISGWDQSEASAGAWSDAEKTANDPCPSGYRVPTVSQQGGLVENNTRYTIGTWSESATNYSSGYFFGDNLMLPATGYRHYLSGAMYYRGKTGTYWSSSGDSISLQLMSADDVSWNHTDHRLRGISVRCIVDSSGLTTYYLDSDGDGYGDPDSSIESESQPSGYVTDNTDCNDTDPDVHPDAEEVCGNGIDDDCGGTIDEDCGSHSGECGAYIAPGVWKKFDCYNLAAIGRTTNDDPFTPSWRLIGGYWQWGRKGPDSSQWYDSNTSNFSHGPTGSDETDANSDSIDGWDRSYAADGAWSDTEKTANDPCPDGYRVPTYEQWSGVIENNTHYEVGAWSTNWIDHTNYSSGCFLGDDLMMPAAGSRYFSGGRLGDRGHYGHYWSSTIFHKAFAPYLSFDNNTVRMSSKWRDYGLSVRCVAE